MVIFDFILVVFFLFEHRAPLWSAGLPTGTQESSLSFNSSAPHRETLSGTIPQGLLICGESIRLSERALGRLCCPVFCPGFKSSLMSSEAGAGALKSWLWQRLWHHYGSEGKGWGRQSHPKLLAALSFAWWMNETLPLNCTTRYCRDVGEKSVSQNHWLLRWHKKNTVIFFTYKRGSFKNERTG